MTCCCNRPPEALYRQRFKSEAGETALPATCDPTNDASFGAESRCDERTAPRGADYVVARQQQLRCSHLPSTPSLALPSRSTAASCAAQEAATTPAGGWWFRSQKSWAIFALTIVGCRQQLLSLAPRHFKARCYTNRGAVLPESVGMPFAA